MLNEQHTLVSIVRKYVEMWRKRESWSRETVAAVIIEKHEEIEGPRMTNIRFDPMVKDIFVRTKVNGERIFRWLDDQTKVINLLPANFIHSILLAMPTDLQLQCIDELLRPLGMASRRLNSTADTAMDTKKHLTEMIREDAESHMAYTSLMANPDPLSLNAALKELNESIEAKLRIRRVLEAAIGSFEMVRRLARTH
jgi:hypothetical protein